MFRIVLRGGPPLPDEAKDRVLDTADLQYVIERITADGATARFRISGGHERVDGRTRRIYTFEEVCAPLEASGV